MPGKAKPSIDEQAAELIKAFPPKQSGNSCNVGLSPNRELVAALHRQGAQHRQISRILSERFGETLRDGNLARHFRGDCMCPRS